MHACLRSTYGVYFSFWCWYSKTDTCSIYLCHCYKSMWCSSHQHSLFLRSMLMSVSHLGRQLDVNKQLLTHMSDWNVALIYRLLHGCCMLIHLVLDVTTQLSGEVTKRKAILCTFLQHHFDVMSSV
jgi:hypothetical protein